MPLSTQTNYSMECRQSTEYGHSMECNDLQIRRCRWYALFRHLWTFSRAEVNDMNRRSVPTRDEFLLAGARWIDRFGARREGRKDGRRALPELPSTLDEDGRIRLARTGYQRLLQARVDVVSEKYAAIAQQEHSRLVEELLARATDVVFHDEAGTLERMHRSRLQTALTRWAGSIQPQRSVVAAAVAEANQLLECYWSVTNRRHRHLRAIRAGRLSPPVMTDADGNSVLFDPSAWGAEPIALDYRWERPEEFLIRQPDILPGDKSSHRYGPLARALDILRYMSSPRPDTGG
jgi:hypothetical protein